MWEGWKKKPARSFRIRQDEEGRGGVLRGAMNDGARPKLGEGQKSRDALLHGAMQRRASRLLTFHLPDLPDLIGLLYRGTQTSLSSVTSTPDSGKESSKSTSRVCRSVASPADQPLSSKACTMKRHGQHSSTQHQHTSNHSSNSLHIYESWKHDLWTDRFSCPISASV